MRESSRKAVVALAIGASGVLAPEVRAQSAVPVNPYHLVQTFELPSGSFDVLPDGRLLAIDGTGQVRIQDSINASTYSPAGSVGMVNSSGFAPSFVSLSPDGSTLAVGNNEFNAGNAVLFFDAGDVMSGSASPTASITTPNFTAAWSDNDTLFVTGADASSFATGVFRLELSDLSATTVIEPAGGFSGDVAIQNDRLYAGEGNTGDVRSFDLDTLEMAGSSIDIASGDFVASNASAGSIDFDSLGNIIIAGGVFDFGTGTFSGSAAVIDPLTQTTFTFTPEGADHFYGAYFNPASEQLVVTVDGTAYVYAVPSPSTAAPFVLAFCVSRRRRTRLRS
ncbi:MAG TPA: hypothetical protein ENJ00_05490 [Phycisphaerales bacterium]|nr:hypothetical protein [Phycisphaerales bacterium]